MKDREVVSAISSFSEKGTMREKSIRFERLKLVRIEIDSFCTREDIIEFFETRLPNFNTWDTRKLIEYNLRFIVRDSELDYDLYLTLKEMSLLLSSFNPNGTMFMENFEGEVSVKTGVEKDVTGEYIVIVSIFIDKFREIMDDLVVFKEI